MTHSATPWFYKYGMIASASRTIAEEIDDNDAEFIVTAVNAYDADQALIRQLVEALGEYEHDGSMKAWMRELLDAARKAGF